MVIYKRRDREKIFCREIVESLKTREANESWTRCSICWKWGLLDPSLIEHQQDDNSNQQQRVFRKTNALFDSTEATVTTKGIEKLDTEFQCKFAQATTSFFV